MIERTFKNFCKLMNAENLELEKHPTFEMYRIKQKDSFRKPFGGDWIHKIELTERMKFACDALSLKEINENKLGIHSE